jgi:flagellum-specific ATP synthase
VSAHGQEMLRAYFDAVAAKPGWRWRGRVSEANGQTIESDGPPCSVGECCEIVSGDGTRSSAEVIGFRGRRVIAMPLVATRGLRHGDVLYASGRGAEIAIGECMQGRVLDAMAMPLDEKGPLLETEAWLLDADVAKAMDRVPIRDALMTGVRAIDGMLTVGCGQRVGIFGGSGVGKSTLIGMMTRNTEADITVVGLVGERGREVREFLDDALGEEGRKQSVVFVSTSDQSPLLRMRAAMAATAAAEFYARRGKNVLLVLDSLTRYAMAAREVGLAAGEPPASKGYTPSVFAHLAKLVERAGRFEVGSITAFYTVLMEGDDQQDPIVDAVRSLLDGHVVLSRALSAEGWYPPIHVLDSLSRLMPMVTTEEHSERARLVRRLMAIHARSEDLVRMGAYAAGADKDLDRAMVAMPLLRNYLEQHSDKSYTMAESVKELQELVL